MDRNVMDVPKNVPYNAFRLPGTRFSKAPETFQARKAIFSLSVSKNS